MTALKINSRLYNDTSMLGGYIPTVLPAGSVKKGPIDLVDQGVSAQEKVHAEKVISKLFTAPGVDMVAFYDVERGTYELRSAKGFIRWERWVTPTGEIRYVVVERGGVDLIPSADPSALRSFSQEVAAAGGSGKPVPKEKNSYPDIFERISQLWDDPNAPDLVYIPTTGGDPNHPGAGSHGIPDIVQSRAPLIISGPGIAKAAVTDELVRHTDIAPTVADLLGVQPVLGTNASGVSKLQFLRWQDGSSKSSAIRDLRRGVGNLNSSAQRAVVFAIDGLSQTVLFDEISKGHLPNLARVVANGTTFRNGSIAEYPTVTWANHNTLVTGAAPGHSGILNNSWYNRAQQKEQLITDGGFTNSLRTGRLLHKNVETLYEAVERSFQGALTIAINQPSGRGADMSVLDLKGIGSLLYRLPSILINSLEGFKDDKDDDLSSKALPKSGVKDVLAGAMGSAYFDGRKPPKLAIFEFTQYDNNGHEKGPHTAEARSALRSVDREIGKVLTSLDRKGLTNSTAIIVTADHGMEHQSKGKDAIGGWKKALAEAASEGSKTVERTRFVYLKTMRIEISGSGVARLRIVNDDVNENGVRSPIAGAKITIVDATGKSWQGVSNDDGSINLDITKLKGPIRVAAEHDDFSREQVEIPLSS